MDLARVPMALKLGGGHLDRGAVPRRLCCSNGVEDVLVWATPIREAMPVEIPKPLIHITYAIIIHFVFLFCSKSLLPQTSYVDSLIANVPLQSTQAREIPPPTAVKFPVYHLSTSDSAAKSDPRVPLVSKLREIQRPTDVKVEHLEALGLHVITDATPEDVIPDSSCLPPKEWQFLTVDELENADAASVRPLNNGRNFPGVKTYVERVKELSISNEAAFRSIRRLPAVPGEPSVRLGNAYEFFRSLELMSSFWIDTSQEEEDTAADPMDVDMRTSGDPDQPAPTPTPMHQQINQRTGTGACMPNEYRINLLNALTKLVAYDFGCNVSLPRVEPRLHISSPATSNTPARTSSFPSNVTFVYRTPTDRSSARSGIVEGPLATLSSRPSTGFHSPMDSLLDLSRETIAILLTAQHRAREHQSETRAGEGKWWCTTPRWGGGTGGPIGREGERLEKQEAADELARREGRETEGPSPKRSKKTMSIYDNYRMVRPPSSTWDRKARYLAIGKTPGQPFDDVFLLSALNHHVSLVRARVPSLLLERLAGMEPDDLGGNDGAAAAAADGLPMWRSKWYDMFIAEDRVEAMRCIWGLMAFLMRKIDSGSAEGREV